MTIHDEYVVKPLVNRFLDILERAMVAYEKDVAYRTSPPINYWPGTFESPVQVQPMKIGDWQFTPGWGTNSSGAPPDVATISTTGKGNTN